MNSDEEEKQEETKEKEETVEEGTVPRPLAYRTLAFEAFQLWHIPSSHGHHMTSSCLEHHSILQLDNILHNSVSYSPLTLVFMQPVSSTSAGSNQLCPEAQKPAGNPVALRTSLFSYG